MSLHGIRTITRLELTQRVRTVAWYVLLGLFFVALLAVTGLSFLAVPFTSEAGGGPVYSIIIYVVLLLVVLVSPTLSGNSINGDRDSATLAPVQVTLATTGDIVVGKLVAAWITGFAFLAVAAPFLIIAMLAGGGGLGVLLVSLLILVLEMGIVAGIGVGLSGIIARPLFSVAATYLVVAGLVIGTLIAFALGAGAMRTEVESRSRHLEQVVPYPMPTIPEECMTAAPDQTEPLPQCTAGAVYQEPEFVCGEWEVYTYMSPRPDAVWWILAANPFVILADATPTAFDQGYPVDLFGQIKYSVRSAQIPPGAQPDYDGCATEDGQYVYPTPEEQMQGTAPSWFVGLVLQIALAALLLWRAVVRTRTPAKRMPPGTRIA